MQINVIINGENRQVEQPNAVSGLLESFHLNATMVVVERNGLIIPRSQYDKEPVEAGDAFEIVQMMAGG